MLDPPDFPGDRQSKVGTKKGDFEQASSTLSATNTTHGDYAVLLVTTLEFAQNQTRLT